MSRAWMPMYWADYVADTRHLSRDEHGGYMLLIAHYWHTGSLPDDDDRLARITLCQSQSEWQRLKLVLQPFFDDGWRHKRIDAELSKAAEAYKKRQLASEKGHAARYGKAANGSANAMPKAVPMACQSQSQSHILSSNEDNKPREATPLAILSECMSEATARDLIAHRQKLRKPLTARAAKLLAKDFVAYGNPEEAAEMMIKNGWQGFHPTWVTNQAARAGPSKSQKGWGSLYAELNGYGDGSGQKRIDENVPLLSGGSVDGAGNRDGDASGLSGNLVELFAGNSR